MNRLPSLSVRIVAAVLLLLFYSCQTSKELSIKYTKKALDKDSVEPVKIIAALFPCVTGEVIPGDTTAQLEYYRKLDSINAAYKARKTEYVHDTIQAHAEECIDLVRDYNSLVDEYSSQADYITGLQSYLKVKPPVVRDTISITDTKQVFILQQEVVALNTTLQVQVKQIEKQKERISDLKYTKVVLLAIIFFLLLLIVAGLYFTSRRKLNPLK